MYDGPFPLIRNRIKAVLFDLDGTLVSSYLDFARIRAEIQCPLDVDLLHYIEGLDPDQRRHAEAIVQRHEQADADRAETLPGVEKVLSSLDKMAIATGIVTRNARQTTQTKLRRTGLRVSEVITREDALPKPHPEALHKLCESWGLSPETCIYIGDYRYDIEAARNAGMLAGFYANGEVPDYAREADLVLQDWHGFLEDFERYLGSA